MSRSIQGVVAVATVLVLVATVAAIIDGKVVNLLIGAAMVATTLAGIAVLMERRLGDAYDTGAKQLLRAAVQDLVVAARGSNHGNRSN